MLLGHQTLPSNKGYYGSASLCVKKEDREEFFNMSSGQTAIRVNCSLFRYPEADASLPTFLKRNYCHLTVSFTPERISSRATLPLIYQPGDVVCLSMKRVPSEGKPESMRCTFKVDKFIQAWGELKHQLIF